MFPLFCVVFLVLLATQVAVYTHSDTARVKGLWGTTAKIVKEG